MPLLLLPLLLAGAVLLGVIALPWTLRQRYRRHSARHRAVGWAAGVNAWGLLVSALLFLAGAALTGLWHPGLGRWALIGLAVGVATGTVTLWLTRFEPDAGGLHYTVPRWIALVLTLAVAARIGLAWWYVLGARPQDPLLAWLVAAHSGVALAGALLGHWLAFAWGVRGRLRRAAGLVRRS